MLCGFPAIFWRVAGGFRKFRLCVQLAAQPGLRQTHLPVHFMHRDAEQSGCVLSRHAAEVLEFEQAGFLRRKLDGIGIPWVDCRYIAHSPEGIVADIRSPGRTESGSVASAS